MKSSLENFVNKLSAGYKPVGHQRQYAEESRKFNSQQVKYRYPMASVYQIPHNEMIYHIAISNSDKYPLNEQTVSVILYMIHSLENTELKKSLLEKLEGVSQ